MTRHEAQALKSSQRVEPRLCLTVPIQSTSLPFQPKRARLQLIPSMPLAAGEPGQPLAPGPSSILTAVTRLSQNYLTGSAGKTGGLVGPRWEQAGGRGSHKPGFYCITAGWI